MARSYRTDLKTAEAYFVVGGPDMKPFYPQPGHDPEHDSRFNSAYLRGDAAIDSMIEAGEPADNLSIRDEKIRQITRHVHGARAIEQARQQVTKAFNDYLSK